jgi:hypothetical protein
MSKVLVDKAVLERAIEALDDSQSLQEQWKSYHHPKTLDAYNDLKAAYDAAQVVEPEPVGEVSGHDWSTGLLYGDLEPGTPLYTHPAPAAKPLSDDQRSAIIDKMRDEGYWINEDDELPDTLIDLVEAAHGIKEQS